MIKHIVMWNVAGDDEAERQAAATDVKREFEGLAGLIPGMRLIEIGIDFSGIDYACDVVLYAEFESRQALEDYASHPAHLAVRDRLNGVRIARHQVDYEI